MERTVFRRNSSLTTKGEISETTAKNARLLLTLQVASTATGSTACRTGSPLGVYGPHSALTFALAVTHSAAATLPYLPPCFHLTLLEELDCEPKRLTPSVYPEKKKREKQ